MPARAGPSSSGCSHTCVAGRSELVDANGVATFGSPAHADGVAALHARVEVHDARTYERLLRATSVGLGESYAAGWWDTDDLVAVLRIALRTLRGSHARRDLLHRRLTPLLLQVNCKRLRPREQIGIL